MDLGARKTGLAWCGSTHLVEALDVVPTAQLSQAIRRWVTDLEIDVLVYGLPLRAGKLAGAAKMRREARLIRSVNSPSTRDETGTTDEAMRRRGQSWMSGGCSYSTTLSRPGSLATGAKDGRMRRSSKVFLPFL